MVVGNHPIFPRCSHDILVVSPMEKPPGQPPLAMAQAPAPSAAAPAVPPPKGGPTLKQIEETATWTESRPVVFLGYEIWRFFGHEISHFYHQEMACHGNMMVD